MTEITDADRTEASLEGTKLMHGRLPEGGGIGSIHEHLEPRNPFLALN